MKTRLLKKVRKRYSITHYPKGFMSDNGYFHDGNYLYFRDKQKTYRNSLEYISSPNHYDLAYNEMYRRLLNYIKEDYISAGPRRIAAIKIIKLWHK